MKNTFIAIFTISLLFLGLTYLGHGLYEKKAQADLDALDSTNVKQQLNLFMAGSDIPPIEEDELLIVNIWATWCGPCLAEIPDLNELVQKYKEEKVRFLAFSDEDFSKLEELLAKRPFQFDYEMNWGNKEALKFLKGYDRKNNGASIPIHLMINQQGKVEEVLIGASPAHTKVMASFLNKEIGMVSL